MLNNKIIDLRQLKKFLVVYGYSINPKTSLLTATSPYFKLPIIYDIELVDKIRFLLSTTGTKFSSEDEDLKKDTGLTFNHIQAPGVKSISIESFNQSLIFTPYKKEFRKGFSPLLEKTITLPLDASDAEILMAIKSTLGNSV